MNRFFLTLTLSVLCLFVEAQTTIATYQATTMTVNRKSNGSWTGWQQQAKSDCKIIFDFMSQTATFSEPYMKFEMTDISDPRIEEDYTVVLDIQCRESEGGFPCTISIVTGKDGQCAIGITYPEYKCGYIATKL